MLIKTVDGMDIHCLPDSAICMECNKNLMEMDKCPLCNFDDDGEICIPEFCDAYTEEKEQYDKI